MSFSGQNSSLPLYGPEKYQGLSEIKFTNDQDYGMVGRFSFVDENNETKNYLIKLSSKTKFSDLSTKQKQELSGSICSTLEAAYDILGEASRLSSNLLDSKKLDGARITSKGVFSRNQSMSEPIISRDKVETSYEKFDVENSALQDQLQRINTVGERAFEGLKADLNDKSTAAEESVPVSSEESRLEGASPLSERVTPTDESAHPTVLNALGQQSQLSQDDLPSEAKEEDSARAGELSERTSGVADTILSLSPIDSMPGDGGVAQQDQRPLLGALEQEGRSSVAGQSASAEAVPDSSIVIEVDHSSRPMPPEVASTSTKANRLTWTKTKRSIFQSLPSFIRSIVIFFSPSKGIDHYDEFLGTLQRGQSWYQNGLSKEEEALSKPLNKSIERGLEIKKATRARGGKREAAVEQLCSRYSEEIERLGPGKVFSLPVGYYVEGQFYTVFASFEKKLTDKGPEIELRLDHFAGGGAVGIKEFSNEFTLSQVPGSTDVIKSVLEGFLLQLSSVKSDKASHMGEESGDRFVVSQIEQEVVALADQLGSGATERYKEGYQDLSSRYSKAEQASPMRGMTQLIERSGFQWKKEKGEATRKAVHGKAMSVIEWMDLQLKREPDRQLSPEQKLDALAYAVTEATDSLFANYKRYPADQQITLLDNALESIDQFKDNLQVYAENNALEASVPPDQISRESQLREIRDRLVNKRELDKKKKAQKVFTGSQKGSLKSNVSLPVTVPTPAASAGLPSNQVRSEAMGELAVTIFETGVWDSASKELGKALGKSEQKQIAARNAYEDILGELNGSEIAGQLQEALGSKDMQKFKNLLLEMVPGQLFPEFIPSCSNNDVKELYEQIQLNAKHLVTRPKELLGEDFQLRSISAMHFALCPGAKTDNFLPSKYMGPRELANRLRALNGVRNLVSNLEDTNFDPSVLLADPLTEGTYQANLQEKYSTALEQCNHLHKDALACSDKEEQREMYRDLGRMATQLLRDIPAPNQQMFLHRPDFWGGMSKEDRKSWCDKLSDTEKLLWEAQLKSGGDPLRSEMDDSLISPDQQVHLRKVQAIRVACLRSSIRETKMEVGNQLKNLSDKSMKDRLSEIENESVEKGKGKLFIFDGDNLSKIQWEYMTLEGYSTLREVINSINPNHKIPLENLAFDRFCGDTFGINTLLSEDATSLLGGSPDDHEMLTALFDFTVADQSVAYSLLSLKNSMRGIIHANTNLKDQLAQKVHLFSGTEPLNRYNEYLQALTMPIDDLGSGLHSQAPSQVQQLRDSDTYFNILTRPSSTIYQTYQNPKQVDHVKKALKRNPALKEPYLESHPDVFLRQGELSISYDAPSWTEGEVGSICYQVRETQMTTQGEDVSTFVADVMPDAHVEPALTIAPKKKRILCAHVKSEKIWDNKKDEYKKVGMPDAVRQVETPLKWHRYFKAADDEERLPADVQTALVTLMDTGLDRAHNYGNSYSPDSILAAMQFIRDQSSYLENSVVQQQLAQTFFTPFMIQTFLASNPAAFENVVLGLNEAMDRCSKENRYKSLGFLSHVQRSMIQHADASVEGLEREGLMSPMFTATTPYWCGRLTSGPLSRASRFFDNHYESIQDNAALDSSAIQLVASQEGQITAACKYAKQMDQYSSTQVLENRITELKAKIKDGPKSRTPEHREELKTLSMYLLAGYRDEIGITETNKQSQFIIDHMSQMISAYTLLCNPEITVPLAPLSHSLREWMITDCFPVISSIAAENPSVIEPVLTETVASLVPDIKLPDNSMWTQSKTNPEIFNLKANNLTLITLDLRKQKISGALLKDSSRIRRKRVSFSIAMHPDYQKAFGEERFMGTSTVKGVMEEFEFQKDGKVFTVTYNTQTQNCSIDCSWDGPKLTFVPVDIRSDAGIDSLLQKEGLWRKGESNQSLVFPAGILQAGPSLDKVSNLLQVTTGVSSGLVEKVTAINLTGAPVVMNSSKLERNCPFPIAPSSDLLFLGDPKKKKVTEIRSLSMGLSFQLQDDGHWLCLDKGTPVGLVDEDTREVSQRFGSNSEQIVIPILKSSSLGSSPTRPVKEFLIIPHAVTDSDATGTLTFSNDEVGEIPRILRMSVDSTGHDTSSAEGYLYLSHLFLNKATACRSPMEAEKFYQQSLEYLTKAGQSPDQLHQVSINSLNYVAGQIEEHTLPNRQSCTLYPQAQRVKLKQALALRRVKGRVQVQTKGKSELPASGSFEEIRQILQLVSQLPADKETGLLALTPAEQQELAKMRSEILHGLTQTLTQEADPNPVICSTNFPKVPSGELTMQLLRYGDKSQIKKVTKEQIRSVVPPVKAEDLFKNFWGYWEYIRNAPGEELSIGDMAFLFEPCVIPESDDASLLQANRIAEGQARRFLLGLTSSMCRFHCMTSELEEQIGPAKKLVRENVSELQTGVEPLGDGIPEQVRALLDEVNNMPEQLDPEDLGSALQTFIGRLDSTQAKLGEVKEGLEKKRAALKDALEKLDAPRKTLTEKIEIQTMQRERIRDFLDQIGVPLSSEVQSDQAVIPIDSNKMEQKIKECRSRFEGLSALRGDEKADSEKLNKEQGELEKELNSLFVSLDRSIRNNEHELQQLDNTEQNSSALDQGIQIPSLVADDLRIPIAPQKRLYRTTVTQISAGLKVLSQQEGKLKNLGKDVRKGQKVIRGIDKSVKEVKLEEALPSALGEAKLPSKKLLEAIWKEAKNEGSIIYQFAKGIRTPKSLSASERVKLTRTLGVSNLPELLKTQEGIRYILKQKKEMIAVSTTLGAICELGHAAGYETISLRRNEGETVRVAPISTVDTDKLENYLSTEGALLSEQEVETLRTALDQDKPSEKERSILETMGTILNVSEEQVPGRLRVRALEKRVEVLDSPEGAQGVQKREVPAALSIENIVGLPERRSSLFLDAFKDPVANDELLKSMQACKSRLTGKSGFEQHLEKGFESLIAQTNEASGVTVVKSDQLKNLKKTIRQNFKEASTAETRARAEVLQNIETLQEQKNLPPSLEAIVSNTRIIDRESALIEEAARLYRKGEFASNGNFSSEALDHAVTKLLLTATQRQQLGKAIESHGRLVELHKERKKLKAKKKGDPKEALQVVDQAWEKESMALRSLLVRGQDTQRFSDNPLYMRKFLYTEYRLGIVLRQNQIEVINSIVENPNRLEEMRMGLGKTSTIFPLILEILPLKGKFPIGMVPKELFATNREELDETTRMLFDLSGTALHFSRDMLSREPKTHEIEALLEKVTTLQKARLDGEYILMTVESKCSIANKIIELRSTQSKLAARIVGLPDKEPADGLLKQYYDLQTCIDGLKKMEGIIESTETQVVIDEMDRVANAVNAVNSELQGGAPVDGRVYSALDEIFQIVMKGDEDLKSLKEALLANETSSLSPKAVKTCCQAIAHTWCEQISEEERKELTNAGFTSGDELDVARLEKWLVDDAQESDVNLLQISTNSRLKIGALRKTLSGHLETALKNRFNVQCLFDEKSGCAVVPALQGMALPNTKYSDPLMQVLSTYLALHHTVPAAKFIAKMETELRLDLSARAKQESAEWINKVLEVIDDPDRDLWDELQGVEGWQVEARLHLAGKNYAGREIAASPSRISKQAQTALAQCNITGLTGTGTYNCAPLIKDMSDFDKNGRKVLAEVITKVAQVSTDGMNTLVETYPSGKGEAFSQMRSIISDRAASGKYATHVIINQAGMCDKEGATADFVRKLSGVEATRPMLFVDLKTRQKMICRNREIAPLSEAPLREDELDHALWYYAPADCRGTHFDIPAGKKAKMMVGANTTASSFAQAVYRLRKLGEGHSVEFLVPEQVKANLLPDDEPMKLKDLLKLQNDATGQEETATNLMSREQQIRGTLQNAAHRALHTTDAALPSRAEAIKLWGKEDSSRGEMNKLLKAKNIAFQATSGLFITESNQEAQLNQALYAGGQTASQAHLTQLCATQQTKVQEIVEACKGVSEAFIGELDQATTALEGIKDRLASD
ncbi:hypothetical protein SCG7086_BL_00060, partial [Chlamydiales bacterium SCGC AG-110-P3]